MTNKKAELPKPIEQALATVMPPKKELVLEGDPEQQLAFAMKAANALMKAVAQKPKKVMIRGEQYLEYGDWQTLSRFFGATASVAWTKPLQDAKGVIRGYEARAEVLHQGQVISSAEAMCTREEANWRSRDEFMLRSMAQTRASAKALRNAYGWVAELAGMKSTPAEEMGEVYDQSPVSDKAIPTVTYDNPEEPNPKPWQKSKLAKPKSELAKKKEIVEIVNAIALNPVATKEEYQTYVFDNTGLLLSPENYDIIIEKLTKVKNGEADDHE